MLKWYEQFGTAVPRQSANKFKLGLICKDKCSRWRIKTVIGPTDVEKDENIIGYHPYRPLIIVSGSPMSTIPCINSFNSLAAKLFNLNFHPLEAVSR